MYVEWINHEYQVTQLPRLRIPRASRKEESIPSHFSWAYVWKHARCSAMEKRNSSVVARVTKNSLWPPSCGTVNQKSRWQIVKFTRRFASCINHTCIVRLYSPPFVFGHTVHFHGSRRTCRFLAVRSMLLSQLSWYFCVSHEVGWAVISETFRAIQRALWGDRIVWFRFSM